MVHFPGRPGFPPRSSFRETWLRYDYIGAPWCHENNWGYLDLSERPVEATKMLHDTRQIPYDSRVGNGGVSLRCLSASKVILDLFRNQSSDQENEDVFYVYFMQEHGFRVANLSVAELFSLEILCDDINLHQTILRDYTHSPVYPFALHKPFDIIEVVTQGSVQKEMFSTLGWIFNFFSSYGLRVGVVGEGGHHSDGQRKGTLRG